jgi:hypothetical protein
MRNCSLPEARDIDFPHTLTPFFNARPKFTGRRARETEALPRSLGSCGRDALHAVGRGRQSHQGQSNVDLSVSDMGGIDLRGACAVQHCSGFT